jgi:hypothetical protein
VKLNRRLHDCLAKQEFAAVLPSVIRRLDRRLSQAKSWEIQAQSQPSSFAGLTGESTTMTTMDSPVKPANDGGIFLFVGELEFRK